MTHRHAASATSPSQSRQSPRASRRGVLRGLGAFALLGTAAATGVKFATGARAATATGTLNIPTLLDSTDESGTKVFTLSMQTGTATLRTGLTSSTCGFNGSYLGPTIKVKNGDAVRMDITNNLSAVSTVHWHGLHVPPSVDGGPQNTIDAGATYSPAFTVNQGACTLWYHPHALGTTAQQVGSGLAGMLIVEDDSDGLAALPTTYGTDQFPLIVQSVPVNSSGVIQYTTAGLTSSTTTFPVIVNGANVASATPTLNVDVSRVRFHVLNASITDIITITRSDGGSFTQVATDAALLAAPLSVTSLRLVQGERAEICLDVTSSASVTLQATITAGGARGGSGTSSIVTVTSTATSAADSLPSTLNTFTALDSTAATATRTIALSNSGNTMYINGVAGTSMTAMESNEIMTTLGAIEVWTITNATNLVHSFHLHDVPFQVLSVNGTAPTGAAAQWKDTIEMPAQTTKKIVMQFTDYTDDTYAYMLHCHNVIHEDEGMMTMLMVMAS